MKLVLAATCTKGACIVYIIISSSFVITNIVISQEFVISTLHTHVSAGAVSQHSATPRARAFFLARGGDTGDESLKRVGIITIIYVVEFRARGSGGATHRVA